jgi:hypothetical protein
MLWYKAWLETRIRFFLLAGVILLDSWFMAPEAIARLLANFKPATALAQSGQVTLNSLWLIWAAVAVMLGGAGINTQTIRGGTHGPHGSMVFTLSLPVRRRRLMSVRATLGAIEGTSLIFLSCLFVWSVSPLLRTRVGAPGVLLYALMSIFGSSVFYSLSTLLATFLDEMWQFNSCFLAVGATLLLRLPVKKLFSYDLLRLLGDPTYLAAGSLPWPGILTCLTLSSALLFAAVQIVERKQY